MLNEMDVLRLDERQRTAWLLANRATLMGVGLTWIGMIAWLATGRELSLAFLVAMVPAFALLRLSGYLYYRAR